jgi:hypothetical protein
VTASMMASAVGGCRPWQMPELLDSLLGACISVGKSSTWAGGDGERVEHRAPEPHRQVTYAVEPRVWRQLRDRCQSDLGKAAVSSSWIQRAAGASDAGGVMESPGRRVRRWGRKVER